MGTRARRVPSAPPDPRRRPCAPAARPRGSEGFRADERVLARREKSSLDLSGARRRAFGGPAPPRRPPARLTRSGTRVRPGRRAFAMADVPSKDDDDANPCVLHSLPLRATRRAHPRAPRARSRRSLASTAAERSFVHSLTSSAAPRAILPTFLLFAQPPFPSSIPHAASSVASPCTSAAPRPTRPRASCSTPSAPPAARDVASAVSVRYKPTSKKLEIELPPDPRERNRDPDASSALRGGGGVAATRVLVSQDTPGHEGYCVAAMRDGVLRVVPIDRAFQMRPGTAHLDAADERARAPRARRGGGRYGQHGHHLTTPPRSTRTRLTSRTRRSRVRPRGDGGGSRGTSERGVPGLRRRAPSPSAKPRAWSRSDVGPGGGPAVRPRSSCLCRCRCGGARRSARRRCGCARRVPEAARGGRAVITLDAAFRHDPPPGVRGARGGGGATRRRRAGGGGEASGRVLAHPARVRRSRTGCVLSGAARRTSRVRARARVRREGIHLSDGVFPGVPRPGRRSRRGHTSARSAPCPRRGSRTRRATTDAGFRRRRQSGGKVGAGQENARGNEGGGGSPAADPRRRGVPRGLRRGPPRHIRRRSPGTPAPPPPPRAVRSVL